MYTSFILYDMAHSAPTPARRTAYLGLILVAVALLAVGFTFSPARNQVQTWLSAAVDTEKQAAVGPIDAGFARSMMLHHAQAIQMSMMIRSNPSAEIQALAQSIIMKQTREMGVLEGWLTAWAEPVMVDSTPMAWVENAKNVRHLDDQLFQAQCKAQGGAMAGVATREQLSQLQQANGRDQEILFLELMLAHHRAALPMAWFANRNGDSSLVKAMASSMIREQGMEIGWMQMKLKQLKNS